MDGVKWIKIQTNIFDNDKIIAIENMPEGDSLLVIWFKLLALAGKCNKDGMVFLTSDVPYTNELLANRFHKPLSIIQLALNTFVHLNMIEIVDDIILVSNWKHYQNASSLAEIRNYNRLAKQRSRENQKKLIEEKESSKEKDTICDIEKDIEREEVNDMSMTCQGQKKKTEQPKIKFADCVSMKQKEYDTLVEKFGESFTKKCIEKLDCYKGQNGKTYKSDYKAILNWVVDEIKKKYPNLMKKQTEEQIQFDNTALDEWGGSL